MAGCSGGGSAAGGPTPSPSTARELVVGHYDLGESRVLADLYAGLLHTAGYRTTQRQFDNHDQAMKALADGQVDLVPDYAGTLTEFLNRLANGPRAAPKATGDLAATMKALRALASQRHLAVVGPVRATDQTAFAVTRRFSEKYHVTRISDLHKYPGRLMLGGPPACPKSTACIVGLRHVYKLEFAKFVPLDSGGPLTKKALVDGRVQTGLVFSSDGGIPAYGLVVLVDDKHLETVDNVVVAARQQAAQPGVTSALERLSDVLTTTDLQGLNRQVDYEGKQPDAVAKAYLAQHHLT